MIDINVWLALTWDQHPQHVAAAEWFDTIDNALLAFCRFTMLGFLRLLTNRQIMGDSTANVAEAVALYDRWMQDPRVELAPEPRDAEARFRKALALHAAESSTKAIADCYLVGFAGAAAARIVTFDKGLAAMAKSRNIGVELLAPVGITSKSSGERRRPRTGN